MERLWAPWRMAVHPGRGGKRWGPIAGDRAGVRPVVTSRPRVRPPPGHLVLPVASGVFVMFNRYPYNNGHLMVVPAQFRPRACSTLPTIKLLAELLRRTTPRCGRPCGQQASRGHEPRPD